MTVNISDHYLQQIQQRIAAGEFGSVEEAVHAALDAFAFKERQFAPGELDALIQPAVDQIRRGEGISADDVDRHLAEHIRQRTANRLGA